MSVDFSNIAIPNLGISLGQNGSRHNIQLRVENRLVPALAFAVRDTDRNEVALLVEWGTRRRCGCGVVNMEARLYRDNANHRFTDGKVWVDLPRAKH